MNFEHLSLSIDNNVAYLQLTRRALNLEMAEELLHAAIHCQHNDDVRAVLIFSEDSLFSAGGDLAFFASQENLGVALSEMTTYLHGALSVFNNMSAPVIAYVDGTAAGAGFSLCLATDLLIASENARFVMAYTAAGLSPDGSSTYFLPRIIGERRSKELMFSNRKLSAEEALDWGIVNQLHSHADGFEQAKALAHTLAEGPTQAFASVKSLIKSSSTESLDTQMQLETQHIVANAQGNDGQAGIQAFLNKQKPDFSGKQ
ncbi:enoyl-CoA hydratase/isomerase family protein [Pseudoteredinibacter isoporae]|uniref:enoyl-CoA hydratase/isomerase family protein n=1 Tax=Pseudoteredinibacter isoporae TaxID=570281 RepID=UPI00310B07AD